MPESLQVSAIFSPVPKVIYLAWLDSTQHSQFTGSPAEIDPHEGGRFTAWDGYILGTTVELEPYARIRQAWRTTEFPEGSPDSDLQIMLEPTAEGTRVVLVHTNIPDGQAESYRQGWEDYYFAPMQAYFNE